MSDANLELGRARRMLLIFGAVSAPHLAVAGHLKPILAWLHHHEKEMVALLEELVAIPTENPPGKKYRACANLLEARLRERGLACQRYDVSPARGSLNDSRQQQNTSDEVDIPVNLLASYGQGDRTVYFHGHYDVVPAQSPEEFQPHRKGHFLFGRGSCDMKGGIVAMLFGICALRECGVPLNGKIGLTLVPDEETGGARGSAGLAHEGLLGQNAIGMLLAEPTSGTVWNANRGALSMRVNVFGKSAHVGLQHQGESAFEHMLRVVEKFQELKGDVERRKTSHNVGSAHRSNSILMLGGQSGGGSNFNVVPAHCWFTLDRRINPEENLEMEKSRLLGILEKCRRDGIPLEWEILQEGNSASCSENEDFGHALARSVTAVTGEAPRFEMCPGLLETRFYAAQGIPAYAYGP